MNRTNKNVLESLERAKQYLTDHPVTPANTQVTALTTQIQAVIVTMTDQRNRQELGLGKFADGSATKAEAATELRRQMKRISKIGKELDPVQFPNLRQTLRMPNKGYQGLQSRAETFVTTVTPIKATFVDRGLPADFDEQLQDALDAFEAATQRQSTGRAQRVQGTKGLSVTASKGRKIIREIDSILFALYEDEPASTPRGRALRVSRTSLHPRSLHRLRQPHLPPPLRVNRRLSPNPRLHPHLHHRSHLRPTRRVENQT